MDLPEVEYHAVQSSTEEEFVRDIGLPFLQTAQNQDGGWGFRPGAQSRVEPTAWSLLALKGMERAGRESPTVPGLPPTSDVQKKAIGFLRAAQLPDGSWPAWPDRDVGCWATSLACWALSDDDPDSRQEVRKGLGWICEDWPHDSTFLKRAIQKLLGSKKIVAHDNTVRGWGWTPKTASWVEPTAFALIVLSQVTPTLLPANAKKRQKLAKGLIYDRMCPGGGWNCGNPMVYGVAGEPLIEPTVWALLALRGEPESEEKALSLEWLEKSVAQTFGAGSIALAKICLDAYGRKWPEDAPSLVQLYEANSFLGSVPVIAWSCISFSGSGKSLVK